MHSPASINHLHAATSSDVQLRAVEAGMATHPMLASPGLPGSKLPDFVLWVLDCTSGCEAEVTLPYPAAAARVCPESHRVQGKMGPRTF